jgi:outer membrane protein TolC
MITHKKYCDTYIPEWKGQKKLFSTISSYFYLFLLISIYFILFPSAFLHAQSDSLIHYLELAVRNNPLVLQKYNEYQAALQKIPQAGSLPDPELSMGVFLSPMELVSGNQVADLRLMQMFPWFGTLRTAKDEMSLMANARYESFREAKLQVFYEVEQTWYELYKVQQHIRISEKNTELLQTIERLALVRFRNAPLGSSSESPSGSSIPAGAAQNTSGGSQGMSGMGINAGSNTAVATNQTPQTMQGNPMGSSAGGSSLTDLYRIQIEYGELENNIALLRNQQNTLVAQFNSYLNRPVISPVSLPDTLPADTLRISLLAVSDSMLANNPMLGMLQYEQKSLESREKMVTKMGYPMIGLGLNYSVINKNEMSTSAMNGKDMVMPMVTMTLPIYRKKYKAMQTEADLLKSATAQHYTASANSLKTEYYQAVQLYQDAQRRVALYTNQSLLTGKSLDIMMKSFAVSGSGLTELLRVRQQVLDYEYKNVEAVADFNTAIAWLKRLMAFQQIQ